MYASFTFRQLPVACSTSGTVLQTTGSWEMTLKQGYRCAPFDTSFTLLMDADYLCVAVSSMQQPCRTLVFSYFRYLLLAHSGPVRVLTRAACSVDG